MIDLAPTYRREIINRISIRGYLESCGDYEFFELGESVRVVPCPVSGSQSNAFSIIMTESGIEYYTAFSPKRLAGFEDVPESGTIADFVCGVASSFKEVLSLLKSPPLHVLGVKGGKKTPVAKIYLAPSVIAERHDHYVKALWANPKALSYLTDVRGLSAATIRKFGLGWSEKRGAISHPCFSDPELATVTHIRFKMRAGHLGASEEGHVSQLADNSAGDWLYNEFTLKRPTVWLVEGEFDALQLYDKKGVHAVALGGRFDVGSERYKKIMALSGVKVFLAFDADEAGAKYTDLFKPLVHANDVYHVTCIGGGKDPDEWCRSGKDFSLEKISKAGVLTPDQAANHEITKRKRASYEARELAAYVNQEMQAGR